MKLTAPVVLALAGLSVAACQSAIESRENLLSAAGFRTILADTPAKAASLKKLPPHRFITETKGGQSYYVYADPTVCGCLYYGNEDSYQAYRRMVFAQNLADQQQTTAMMMQQAAFDYGPWGPGPWMGGAWVGGW